jgi:hypothetical protein
LFKHFGQYNAIVRRGLAHSLVGFHLDPDGELMGAAGLGASASSLSVPTRIITNANRSFVTLDATSWWKINTAGSNSHISYRDTDDAIANGPTRPLLALPG